MKRSGTSLCLITASLVLCIRVLSTPAIAAETKPQTFAWPRPLPEAGASALPRWRGFNLQHKFHLESANLSVLGRDAQQVRRDFEMIAALGFNFVRLPLDYRIWIANGNWHQLDERNLREIDALVALAREHGLHVSLNFHRAPGWTVHTPAEERNLWTDPEAQRVCATHWAAFARRFRGIPSRELSFNPVNEPGGVDAASYLHVMRQIVDAIRAEDPDRLIIADGLDYGTAPVPAFLELGLAMATRGYQPFGVTHHEAAWIDSIPASAHPTWPDISASAVLGGPDKPELQQAIEIYGPLGGLNMRVCAESVSRLSHLRAVDQDERIIWEHRWCHEVANTVARIAGDSSWHEFAIPHDITKVRLENIEGDWMRLAALELIHNGRLVSLPLNNMRIEQPFEAVVYSPEDKLAPLRITRPRDAAWIARQLDPWRAVAGSGVGVMVSEMGAYRFTPHPTVLAWMRDMLTSAQEAGFGWALWEFRGPFGILDSGRTDVNYADWNGHKLDLEMLQLLQDY